MRILISGVLGGLVFFFWGAVAHLALPIGTMGMTFAAPHAAVLGAMKQDFQGEGVYILPSLPKDKMGDADATKAFAPTETSNPYAFVVYQPQGEDTSQMGDNLGKQWASDTFSALIVSYVLALGAFALMAWLVASAGDGESFACFQSVAGSPIGKIALFAFTAALVYHFLNGIRHLLWDVGWGFEIPQVYGSGYVVLALTAIITAVIVFVALNAGGAA